MKRPFSILTLLLFFSCAVKEDPTTKVDPEVIEPEPEYAVPELAYDSPEEPYVFISQGYQFTETSNCDTLTEEELIHIDTTNLFDLKIWMNDSIHISYYDVGNVCGFFEGYYDFENDTVFIHDREDAYDGCGDYCLFKLEYVVPKPASEFVLMVNNELQEH